jgi:tetratricopeptide (TPR) repeat protein
MRRLAASIISVVVALAVFAWACGACGCGTTALPPKALALNESGAAALAAGDLAVAEARLQVAIEYSPRFVEAWVNLGLVELRRGNLDAAKRDLEKARDINPDLPAPHHGLGLLFDARDMGREAELNYRAALKVDPGFAPSRWNLARRLFARGAFEEAREQFLRLVEVAPEREEGWLGLAECYVRLGREGEADDVIARARTRFGDDADVVLLVARQLLRRGAFDAAESSLAALTHDRSPSRRAAAWAWIAVAREGRGDVEGAIDAADEALAIDRDHGVATFAMAKALEARGDPQAAAWLAKSRRLAPPPP